MKTITVVMVIITTITAIILIFKVYVVLDWGRLSGLNPQPNINGHRM